MPIREKCYLLKAFYGRQATSWPPSRNCRTLSRRDPWGPGNNLAPRELHSMRRSMSLNRLWSRAGKKVMIAHSIAVGHLQCKKTPSCFSSPQRPFRLGRTNPMIVRTLSATTARQRQRHTFHRPSEPSTHSFQIPRFGPFSTFGTGAYIPFPFSPFQTTS